HFNALRNSGCTVSQVNKAIKTAKAIFTYAFDSEYVISNVMQRHPKLQPVDGEPTANRGVFTETELQAIFATATPFELALFGTLSISGPRPGEIYALERHKCLIGLAERTGLEPAPIPMKSISYWR